MGLIEKLEQFINDFLIKMGNLFQKALAKMLPQKVQDLFLKIQAWILALSQKAKAFPKTALKKFPEFLAKFKATLATFNVKQKLQETYKTSLARYQQSNNGKKFSAMKSVFMAPFLIVSQWLHGLSSAQIALLLGFTSASFLMGINMIFSGQRIVNHHYDESRSPASAEEEIEYSRPAYYKKQTRHLQLTNLRLPVYFANINELKSIDIDFNATLSNRMSRMQLEKLEFQLRDHLILHIEPMVASFPLEDEGKDILKEKLEREVADFMRTRGIEGEVKDLKIIYILAN